MTGWAVRGIGMGLVNVVVRLLLGAAVSLWPLSGSALRWVAFALVLLVIIVWAGIDGIRDRRKHSDPDDGEDLTIVWLKAAVVGGLLGGLLSWVVGFVVDFSLGQNSLLFELTFGAAFTILTIIVASSIAMFVGRLIVNRENKKRTAGPDAQNEDDRRLVNAGQSDRAASDGGTRSDQIEPTRSEPTHSEPTHSEPQWASEHGEADTEVFSAVDADGNPRSDTRANRHGAADGS